MKIAALVLTITAMLACGCAFGGPMPLVAGKPDCVWDPQNEAGIPRPTCMPRQRPEPVPPSPVDEARLRAYRVAGPAIVSGQAFLRQRGGGVVTCAGARVRLLPSPEADVGHDRRCRACRETVCDAQGRFRFDGVPARAWILSTEVRWVVAGFTEGGVLTEILAVKPGRNEIVLTR